MRECQKCGTCYGDDILNCRLHEAETKQTLPGPQRLANRYFIESRLGRGAMGQVYLARDENLGTRQVAVKTVRPDLLASEDLQEGEAVARFQREAQAAASIRHPNVVDVTDFGKSVDGVFFLVMEYVKGETLHDLLRREGTLTTTRAFALLAQIGAGVDAAHDAGILHRDLKPANIFLLKTGRSNDDGFIKVGDFGLAKIVGETVSEIGARNGPASRGIIGTPEFMAPEQMQSELPIDVRADIYALGTIAYQMLCGRVPFTGDLMTIITQKMTGSPPPLSRVRTDIAPEIEAAIMHALEREPAKRPPTVMDWIEQLEKVVTKDQKSAKPIETEIGRVVVLAPIGAEVYVDDERKGSVGSSGRVILSSVPPGRHVLRVSRRGEKDDEREIEIRPDSTEQVIQAVLRATGTSSQPSSSQRGEIATPKKELPEVVVCMKCEARFAAGAKFCGRCGNGSFQLLNPSESGNSQIYNSNTSSNPQQSTNQPSAPNRFVINTSQPNQPPQNSASGSFNCPRCKHLLPATAQFCGGCGLNLVQQRQPNTNSVNQPRGFANVNQSRPNQVICQTCKVTYSAGTRFCGKCGGQIAR